MTEIIALLISFSFYYPLFMAYLWMIGGIYYYFHWERRDKPTQIPQLSEYPPVSILVPCHNEEQSISETIISLLAIDYPAFEIIAINDGSTDKTGRMLELIAQADDCLRVVHFKENQGKAVALRTGALLSPHEFLITIDGDAQLDPNAVTWIMRHFNSGPRVAAVTGNPRIRSRSTLLGKVQVGEFSAIIGLIKRAQRIYGRIFTIAGVVSGFRKSALHRVGYWDSDMLTEDIDISWKLQLDHWDIRFEPNALCWILTPETFSGLWRQRLRWARGGTEIVFKYWRKLFSWRKRRMWPIFVEIVTSGLWSYAMLITTLLWLMSFIVDLPEGLKVGGIIPGWYGVVLAFTCLLQFFVSLAIEARYERGVLRYYFWIIWYPVLYWILGLATMVSGVFLTLIKKRNVRARWTSPDRGILPT